MSNKGRQYYGKLPGSVYTVEKELGVDKHGQGKGGMGSVFLARNQNQKEVAVKIFKPGINDIATFTHRDKLILEAKILKGFWGKKAPNVIRYIDEAKSPNPDDFFLVIEKVNGKTVTDKVIKHHSIDENEIIKIIIPILKAIHFLHRQNTVHRDIKPGNIMVRETGGSVLIDFGAAKQTENVQSIQTIWPTLAYTQDWTCHHQQEGRTSPQCDIYALGRTMFFMATGKPPRKYTKAQPSLQDHRKMNFTMITTVRDENPNFSLEFSNLVDEMLESEHRTFHTADSVLKKLQFIQPSLTRSKKIGHLSSGSITSKPRVLLLGTEHELSKKQNGTLIGSIHDEHKCTQNSGSQPISCNSFVQGTNISIGDWGCPHGCVCYNPGHIVPKHHMRILNDNGQWFAVNNSTDRQSAIFRQPGGWHVMQSKRKERLQNKDEIALLYVKPESEIPITLTFYTQ